MTVRELIEVLEALDAPEAQVVARDPRRCGQDSLSEDAWWHPAVRWVRVKERTGERLVGIEGPPDRDNVAAHTDQGRAMDLDGNVVERFTEAWSWEVGMSDWTEWKGVPSITDMLARKNRKTGETQVRSDWTHWMGVPGITDMLVRKNRKTGETQVRVLPADVTRADVERQRGAEARQWDDNHVDEGGE